MIHGVVRIEFQIDNGQMQLMVHGPMDNQDQKNLTIQVLSGAIPIVLNYKPSILINPNGNGNGKGPLKVIPPEKSPT